MHIELIKNKFEEATKSCWPRQGKLTAGEYSHNLEKFAELIIRECINEIHGANLGDLPDASYYLDKVSEHIEKHFGLNDE